MIISSSITVTLMHQWYETNVTEMVFTHSSINYKTCARGRMSNSISILYSCFITIWYKLFVWKLLKSNFLFFTLQLAKVCLKSVWICSHIVLPYLWLLCTGLYLVEEVLLVTVPWKLFDNRPWIYVVHMVSYKGEGGTRDFGIDFQSGKLVRN